MSKPFYRSIDHLWIRLPEVEPLYDFLSLTLGLPVTWPLQRSDSATFGRVTVGNVNLELWTGGTASTEPAAVAGIALDPVDLSHNIERLGHMGLTCKALRPYEAKNAQGETLAKVTNAVLFELSSQDCSVFFSDWDFTNLAFPRRGRRASAGSKKREKDAMASRNGGRLGMVGLSEIEMETPDVVESTLNWQLLAGSADTPVQITEDIRLRLVPGPTVRVRSLTFAVKSLAAASDFLAANTLVGDARPNEVLLSERVCSGLKFRLVEQKVVGPLAWPELAQA